MCTLEAMIEALYRSGLWNKFDTIYSQHILYVRDVRFPVQIKTLNLDLHKASIIPSSMCIVTSLAALSCIVLHENTLNTSTQCKSNSMQISSQTRVNPRNSITAHPFTLLSLLQLTSCYFTKLGYAHATKEARTPQPSTIMRNIENRIIHNNSEA